MPAHQKSRALHKAHPAARKADRLGDFLRDVDIGRIQENVVGDQKLARAHDGRARRRMHPRLAEVRLARRIGRNLRANSFKLPAPDVFQILPLRRSRRRLVQINRNLKSLPDLLAHMTRHGDAILDGHAINRNERHHVGRAHARMRALMLGQINQLRGLAHAANRRFLDRLPLADQRDHAAVVVGIHLAIEQIDAVDLHRLDDGVHFCLSRPSEKLGTHSTRVDIREKNITTHLMTAHP